MADKVLIIEDDEFLRELILRKVESEGFNVSIACNGEEGLKKIREEKPQLVLLDLILPNMDGFEVLTKVKEDEELSSIPVVIPSNLGQKEDIEKALKIGAADYLIKAHFTPSKIIEKIRNILS